MLRNLAHLGRSIVGILAAMLLVLLGFVPSAHAIGPTFAPEPSPIHAGPADEAPPAVIVLLASYRAHGPPVAFVLIDSRADGSRRIFIAVRNARHSAGANIYAAFANDPVNNSDPDGLRVIVPNAQKHAFAKWWEQKGLNNWSKNYQYGETLHQEGFYVSFSMNPFKDFQQPMMKYSEVYPQGPLDLSAMSEPEQMFALMVADPDHTYVFDTDRWRLSNDSDNATAGIKARNAIYPRLDGALQMVGGVGEAAIGATAIAAPEPTMITKVVGGIAVAHGVDNASAGANTLIFGQPTQTFTSRLVQGSMELMNVNPQLARQIGEGSNASLSLGTMGWGAYRYFTAPKLALMNQAPKLYSYTASAEFSGDIFKVGNAGRAWATTHAPGAWAFEGGMQNGLLRMWRTGSVQPFNAFTEITGPARGAFVPVSAFGPARGWKRLSGQYFTTQPGNLSLTTGEIMTPTAQQVLRFWGDRTTYHGLDAAAWAAAVLHAADSANGE